MIKDVNLSLISTKQAEEIKNALCGGPTENRVLICSLDQKDMKVGGLYLPDNVAKDELPRKGVIITSGRITEEYRSYEDTCTIPGIVVTYGVYAGKEIQPKFSKEMDTTNLKFHVLSLSEIIFIEPNDN